MRSLDAAAATLLSATDGRRPQEPGRSRQRQPAVPAGGSRCPTQCDPPMSAVRAATAGWPGVVREDHLRRAAGRGNKARALANCRLWPSGRHTPAGESRKCGRRQPLPQKLRARGDTKEVDGQGKARSHRGGPEGTQDADKNSACCPGPRSATRWQLQRATLPYPPTKQAPKSRK